MKRELDEISKLVSEEMSLHDSHGIKREEPDCEEDFSLLKKPKVSSFQIPCM